MTSAGGRSRAREVRILHFGGGRAESLAPGAWPPSPPAALLPTPRHCPGGTRLLFPRGAGQRRLKWKPRCASRWFELVPSSPQQLSTKWRTPPRLPPPPPPPAAPPGAMSAADMAPSPAAGGGRRASRGEGGEEAPLGGAGCRGGALPGIRALPRCPLGERCHYPRSVPHGNGPRFKALLGEKEQGGTSRRGPTIPYRLAARGEEGEVSPLPTAGAVAPTGDRAQGWDGQRNLPAGSRPQERSRHSRDPAAAQTSPSCYCQRAGRKCSPRARVTSRWATNDPGSSNLMDQSGKNPRHGQEEDWQFIGSTGCGRL